MSIPPPKDNYIGEPQYPDPWTTARPLEGLRDTDQARIVSLSPDVCLTPCGSSVVPVPYPVIDYCGHDQSYTPTVRFTGQKAMVLHSNTTHVHGDSPGTRKGVKSGTVEGICEPIGHAEQVRAEGSHVIRHLDRFHMNNRNTVGEAIFVRDTVTYPALEDDDPAPGSLRLADTSGSWAAYANASSAQVQSAPAGGTSPPTNAQPAPRPSTPSPRPPGQVIRPDVPQWRRPPLPTAPPTIGQRMVPWLWRLGKFGARAAGTIVGVLWADPLGAPLSETIETGFPRDAEEWAIIREAEQAIANGTLAAEAAAAYAADAIREWRAWQDEYGPPAPEVEEEPRPVAVPEPEPGARVDEDGSQRRCLVGPYEEIKPLCRGEAHHIVPDMAYRLGRRPTTAAAMASTENRIPNAPTFNQGMSICLLTRQHGSGPEGLHGQLRQRLLEMTSPVPGTAPMGAILADSLLVIQEIPDLPPECKVLAEAMATGQVATHTGLAAPGRIKEQPLPTGDAKTVLEQGHY